MGAAVEEAELREIIAQHSVCFDVWPLREVRDGELRQIGFELDLVGAVSHAEHTCSPGCTECQAVYAKLRRVAEFTLRPEPDGIRVEIEEYDASFHESRQRGFREDVELQIHVFHAADYDCPVDAPERSRLQRIKEALRSLGVREGRH